MPPKKGRNEKKESGRAKKAENKAKKAVVAAEVAERKEAAQWEDGAKKKKDKEVEREAKKAADAARKAENARLLAEEEAAASSGKPKAAAQKKKSAKDKNPGANAVRGSLGAVDPAREGEVKADAPPEKPETLSATGLDDALEMMSFVTAKTDKASIGQAAARIESHPERRFKAALEAYKERELPRMKVDGPGLRHTQYQDLLYRQFQKSPQNPFNQLTVSYNTKQEERVDVLTRQKDRESNRYRVASL